MENGDTSGLWGKRNMGKQSRGNKEIEYGSLAQSIHYSVSVATRPHMGLQIPLNIERKTSKILNFQMLLSMVVERTRG